ncbi:ATP-binding cassette domain-containing protein [Planctomycetaceae bacterium SH139]
MPHDGIIVENLSKRFDDVTAVEQISFQVEPGEIFGFLGPNGAGKSTTVAILTTLLRPSAGSASVGGFDVATEARAVRQIAGVALQEIGLDPLMTSLELLSLHARLFGMNRRQAQQRAMELIELVQLTDAIERRVGKYSGGMRRRLDLAMALVHQPQILFLDEPTTGLDPASRRDIWDEIRRLNSQFGMTIFLTTQYLEEADALAGRVAIINQGQIAISGTPSGLKAEMGGDSINLDFAAEQDVRAAEQLLTASRDELGIDRLQSDQLTLRLYLRNAAAAVAAVVRKLDTVDVHPRQLTLSQPTLDDVFLRVTGHRYQQE